MPVVLREKHTIILLHLFNCNNYKGIWIRRFPKLRLLVLTVKTVRMGNCLQVGHQVHLFLVSSTGWRFSDTFREWACGHLLLSTLFNRFQLLELCRQGKSSTESVKLMNRWSRRRQGSCLSSVLFASGSRSVCLCELLSLFSIQLVSTSPSVYESLQFYSHQALPYWNTSCLVSLQRKRFSYRMRQHLLVSFAD